MKKTVRVTIEKEIEIDIDDALLTQGALAEFESYMFQLDSSDKVSDVFKYVATQVFEDDCMFVEGFGEARPDRYVKQTDTKIVFNVVDEERYAEIV